MNKVKCDPENWVSAISCISAAQIQDHHPHSRKVCRVSSEDKMVLQGQWKIITGHIRNSPGNCRNIAGSLETAMHHSWVS